MVMSPRVSVFPEMGFSKKKHALGHYGRCRCWFPHRCGLLKKNLHPWSHMAGMVMSPRVHELQFSHRCGLVKKMHTRECLMPDPVCLNSVPKAKGRVLARGRGCLGSQTFALPRVCTCVHESRQGPRGLPPLHHSCFAPFLPGSGAFGCPRGTHSLRAMAAPPIGSWISWMH